MRGSQAGNKSPIQCGCEVNCEQQRGLPPREEDQEKLPAGCAWGSISTLHKYLNQETLDLRPLCSVGPEARHAGRMSV